MVLVVELTGLRQPRLRIAFGILDEELDLSSAHLPADLVEVQLGPRDHVFPDLGERPAERREHPDLDGTLREALGDAEE